MTTARRLSRRVPEPCRGKFRLVSSRWSALLCAGVGAELHVFEAMPHGGLRGTAPEDRQVQAQIATFLKRKLGVTS